MASTSAICFFIISLMEHNSLFVIEAIFSAQYLLLPVPEYREVPPRVEYSLTPIGTKFIPVLEALEQWALEYNAK